MPMPHEGNPNYPLSPDYFKHPPTSEYARLDRINACRQYMVHHKTNERKAIARVESLRFFDTWYLHPDEESEFDPMFYDDPPRETPDFHWDIVGQWALSRFNITIAPRGAAKSTLGFKDMSHIMVTSPVFSYVYATSTNDNALFAGTKVRDVLYNNARLSDDFAQEVEFGGRIEPYRGKLPTGSSFFMLNNRSWMQTTSAESRQRGKRPRRYRLDDPEYDPAASTQVAKLRDALDWRLTKVILPMMFRPGVGCDWIGTFVSKRHLLWAAIRTHEEGGIQVADDPRFNMWTRMIIDAVRVDEQTDKEVSCWPDMWPMTIAEKKANPRLKDTISIEEMPLVLGRDTFLAEMRGRPGDSDTAGFGTISEDMHGYQLREIDSTFENDPRSSATRIIWKRPSFDNPEVLDQIDMSLSDFLINARVLITVDSAKTSKPTSDWKVAHLLAFLRQTNELFSLDLFATKKPETYLMNGILDFAYKWQASIHPEAIKESYHLLGDLQRRVYADAVRGVSDRIPPVRKFNPGMVSKSQKIQSLNYRFEHGLVKLPFWRQNQKPYADLFQQVEDFNPDAPDEIGLEKDDHIDTLSMGHIIVRGKGGEIYTTEEEEDTGTVDMLKMIDEGKTEIAGIPIFSSISPDMLRGDIVQKLLESHDKRTNSDQSVI